MTKLQITVEAGEPHEYPAVRSVSFFLEGCPLSFHSTVVYDTDQDGERTEAAAVRNASYVLTEALRGLLRGVE